MTGSILAVVLSLSTAQFFGGSAVNRQGVSTKTLTAPGFAGSGYTFNASTSTGDANGDSFYYLGNVPGSHSFRVTHSPTDSLNSQFALIYGGGLVQATAGGAASSFAVTGSVSGDRYATLTMEASIGPVVSRLQVDALCGGGGPSPCPVNVEALSLPWSFTHGLSISTGYSLNFESRCDSTGTPGAAACGAANGRAAVAAGAVAVVITNPLVSATSTVLVTPHTLDATCLYPRAAVPGAGSFTFTMGPANCSAAVAFSWMVVN